MTDVPAPSRKYTVEEMEQMREYIWRVKYPYSRQKYAADIEAELRTYMMNGTEPDELRQWWLAQTAESQG